MPENFSIADRSCLNDVDGIDEICRYYCYILILLCYTCT